MFGERVANGGTRAVKAALERRFAHAQDLRCLPRGQPLDVPQHERRAILERQSAHRALQRGASVAALRARLRRLAKVRWLARRLLEGYRAEPALTPLRAALGLVDADPV